MSPDFEIGISKFCYRVYQQALKENERIAEGCSLEEDYSKPHFYFATMDYLAQTTGLASDDVWNYVSRAGRGGDMRLRWSAAGLLEAEKNFRRVRGCKLMPKLLIALDRGAVAESTTAA